MKSPLVSIALIAGPGEGAILRRLIESSRGLWDQVVVVPAVGANDAHSVRQCAEEAAGEALVCEEYHNSPEFKDWPHIDNFAAARNKAFGLATGKYVIWADCDDIFEAGQAAAHRQAIMDREAGKTEWDILVTTYDVQNSGMRNNRRERIFRRMKDGNLPAHWERQIHERVTPAKDTKIAVAEHLKILHAPNGPKISSAERNKRIIASRINGIGMEWYYLAQEHFLKNEYQQAIGPCLLALEHSELGPAERYQLHTQASMMLSDRAKRLEHLGKAITLSPLRREAHGLLAADRMDHGDFTSAYHILKMVDSMPHTSDWNQENRWYKHLPRQFMAQCLRANKQNLEADVLVREGFRSAWGRITVLHIGEPEDCLRSLSLYTDTADDPNAIQHMLVTQRGNKQADRHRIIHSAEEAMGAAAGDILLTVTAKDAKMPGLRWDLDLIENGTIPPGADRLPDPVDRLSRVIVGLTTTPKRIGTILPTIKSLLNQSRPADQIILSVPEKLARTGERFGDIPKEIMEMAEAGKLQIHRTKDYGPATKFIGPLEVGGDPDDMICWLDDDILYSPRLLQTLAQELHNRPKTALGVCGFFITGSTGYAIAPDHGGHAEILEGFGGVMCRRSDMPKAELWPAIPASEFASLSPVARAKFLADDYMMSTELRKAGTATLVCNTPELNRGNSLKIRPEGLGSDALQNNKGTGGNLAAYALLKNG
jgi:glycosyltransferase involved in cell wall biosynthesis